MTVGVFDRTLVEWAVGARLERVEEGMRNGKTDNYFEKFAIKNRALGL